MAQDMKQKNEHALELANDMIGRGDYIIDFLQGEREREAAEAEANAGGIALRDAEDRLN